MPGSSGVDDASFLQLELLNGGSLGMAAFQRRCASKRTVDEGCSLSYKFYCLFLQIIQAPLSIDQADGNYRQALVCLSRCKGHSPIIVLLSPAHHNAIINDRKSNRVPTDFTQQWSMLKILFPFYERKIFFKIYWQP